MVEKVYLLHGLLERLEDQKYNKPCEPLVYVYSDKQTKMGTSPNKKIKNFHN